ncbi:serine hydrolase [Paenibacillus kobensis]|uniref:serine hydrolase n=1 Tax=Paenibacillus kobensis TaxID=59841 RepID=UPI000FD7436A|nr:serine hydrolase [Paenibacillus kobensis]
MEFIILTVILIILVPMYARRRIRQRINRKGNAILRFIEQHPEQSSAQIIHNGEVLFEAHPDRLMPLASTVKIIVAIEYAKQAASGRIQPDRLVMLSELDRFYLKDLDGDAHPNWIAFLGENDRITNDSIRLEEVAKGMIQFSSNANAEYLMEQLGLDNINRNLIELGLTRHEPLYPFVSSLLIPYEWSKQYSGLPPEEAVSQAKSSLREMSPDEFRKQAYRIHLLLQADTDGSYKTSADLHSWYDTDWDKMNSERFISSTTREYVTIMRYINAGNYYDPTVQTHLKIILEAIMEHPSNQQWLTQAGRKGGSTACILTEAIYAEDKQGNATEAAIFFNELNPELVEKLSALMNGFELLLLKDPEFREQLKQQRALSAS